MELKKNDNQLLATHQPHFCMNPSFCQFLELIQTAGFLALALAPFSVWLEMI